MSLASTEITSGGVQLKRIASGIACGSAASRCTASAIGSPDQSIGASFWRVRASQSSLVGETERQAATAAEAKAMLAQVSMRKRSQPSSASTRACSV